MRFRSSGARSLLGGQVERHGSPGPEADSASLAKQEKEGHPRGAKRKGASGARQRKEGAEHHETADTIRTSHLHYLGNGVWVSDRSSGIAG